MNTINCNLHPMTPVTVLGIPALLTHHRVSRNTVHLGFFCYELRSETGTLEYPIILAQTVPEEKCAGTLLTLAPMLMERVHQLMLLPGDITETEGLGKMTPAEFERMYFEKGSNAQRRP